MHEAWQELLQRSDLDINLLNYFIMVNKLSDVYIIWC